MRRRLLWLGGTALLGVAFIAVVVVSRLPEESLKEEDNPHLDGVLNAIVAEYENSGAGGGLGFGAPCLHRG